MERSNDRTTANKSTLVLYTETDVRILMAKLIRLELNNDPGNTISVMHLKKSIHEVQSDFERRFRCNIRDAKNSFPNVIPGRNAKENLDILSKYGQLEYSK